MTERNPQQIIYFCLTSSYFELLIKLRTYNFFLKKVAISESTHGEFCAGAVELQDWLADKFERRLENEGSRDDGQKETKLIAEFRNTLRTSLLVGLAKGHAQMLRAAGLPHGGERRSRPPTAGCR